MVLVVLEGRALGPPLGRVVEAHLLQEDVPALQGGDDPVGVVDVHEPEPTVRVAGDLARLQARVVGAVLADLVDDVGDLLDDRGGQAANVVHEPSAGLDGQARGNSCHSADPGMWASNLLSISNWKCLATLRASVRSRVSRPSS